MKPRQSQARSPCPFSQSILSLAVLAAALEAVTEYRPEADSRRKDLFGLFVMEGAAHSRGGGSGSCWLFLVGCQGELSRSRASL